ncbi:hypothetical protein TNCT_603881 [Trichonephila clavata]|uniref:Uncharacterized protein n=1 Tax=Trichonephila clavata TaxID=2740835 RepID=A0A8X6IHU1_TRICU|nr:hypothetical protein TNCT_603881 [Trichonephila clavata]
MALSLSHLQRYHEKAKHVVTILNRKASVRASIGNMRLHHLQKNQRPVLRSIHGHRFTTDSEVCEWVRLGQQPTSFFKDRIDQLMSQWDKCANSFGDYS